MQHSKIVKFADAPCLHLRRTPRLPPVVSRATEAAYADARQVTDLAREEADAIVSAAKRDAEAIREFAREEGYRSGLVQWNEFLQSARAQSEAIFRQHEEDLIRIAIRAAEKIIGEELRQNRDAAISIAKNALSSARRERSVVIHVHPDEVAFLRSRIAELHVVAASVREIHVMGNAAVTPGGCTVESEFGNIDARLETQVSALEEAVLRSARTT